VENGSVIVLSGATSTLSFSIDNGWGVHDDESGVGGRRLAVHEQGGRPPPVAWVT
jgi:hypothetical protein